MSTNKRSLLFILFFLAFFVACKEYEEGEPALFIPTITDGLSFTVTGYNDYKFIDEDTQPGEGVNRPVTFLIRVRNIDHPSITIRPESFMVIDAAGNSHQILNIVYFGHPAGDRELRQGEQFDASLLFSTDQALEELSLQFTPFSSSNPFKIKLIIDEAKMILPISIDDVLSEITEEDFFYTFDESIRTTKDLLDGLSTWSSGFEPPSILAIYGLGYSEGGNLGSLGVFVYVSRESVEMLYRRLERTSIEPVTILSNFSEAAFTNGSELVFRVCHVLIRINYFNSRASITSDEKIEYAQLLDARLTRVACP